MKLTVDVARCQGHGRCAIVAPDLVKLNGDGYVTDPEIEVPSQFEALAMRVARSCPEGVIRFCGPNDAEPHAHANSADRISAASAPPSFGNTAPTR